MNGLLKKSLIGLREAWVRLESRFDRHYLAVDVPAPKIVGHMQWPLWLRDTANRPGVRILEVGSREVSGPQLFRDRFKDATYVGFDLMPGNNVDVVGDAHRLSSYFGEEERFDVVYSAASFEHFAMPWVVATEIAKVLKVGGLVLVETHFSHSSHERPWHFFQFSDLALRVLFSEAMGFECLDAGMSNPIVGRFSSLAAPPLRNKPVPGLYCHAEFLGRKAREVPGFDWHSVDLAQVVGGTSYPELGAGSPLR